MKTHQTVTEYFATLPEEARVHTLALQSFLRELLPEATEVIKYGIPTFVQNGNIIHYAGYKHHVGLYPGAGCIAHFHEQLSAYNVSKGTVQFKLDAPLPWDLIEKMVAYNLMQLSTKKTKSIPKKP